MNDFESLSLKISCVGEELWLHPQRVMYWPAGDTLFAADVHVGKEHAFARSGIAIPGGISEDVLLRLFALCDDIKAGTLMVLGDFMHCTPLAGESWLAVLSELLAQRPQLTVGVIAGNHDKAAGQAMIDNRVRWYREATQYGPFVLQHEPSDDASGYVLAGHLHPAWRLQVAGHQSIRAPVFWFRKQHAVLPAFGTFTGGMGIEPDTQYDRLFMAGDRHVMAIPNSALQPGRRRRYSHQVSGGK